MNPHCRIGKVTYKLMWLDHPPMRAAGEPLVYLDRPVVMDHPRNCAPHPIFSCVDNYSAPHFVFS